MHAIKTHRNMAIGLVVAFAIALLSFILFDISQANAQVTTKPANAGSVVHVLPNTALATKSPYEPKIEQTEDQLRMARKATARSAQGGGNSSAPQRVTILMNITYGPSLHTVKITNNVWMTQSFDVFDTGKFSTFKTTVVVPAYSNWTVSIPPSSTHIWITPPNENRVLFATMLNEKVPTQGYEAELRYRTYFNSEKPEEQVHSTNLVIRNRTGLPVDTRSFQKYNDEVSFNSSWSIDRNDWDEWYARVSLVDMFLNENDSSTNIGWVMVFDLWNQVR